MTTNQAEKIKLKLRLWPRQKMALLSRATEILFGGASEGGKSHFARVFLIVWCIRIPQLQCSLIRKKYDDIIKNHVEGPTGFRAMLRPLIDAGKVRVTKDGVKFWNGSNIDFVHCFTGDTPVQTSTGTFSLKSLTNASGYVNITTNNPRRYYNVRKTRDNAEVVKITFSDGFVCRCTPEHKFVTINGVVEARDLEGKSCVTNESKLSAIQSSISTASGISSTVSTLVGAMLAYTVLFGLIIMAQSLRAMRFTTKTKIGRIIKSKTLRFWNALSTGLCTLLRSLAKPRPEGIYARVLMRLESGMAALRGLNGTNNSTSGLRTSYTSPKQRLAASVVKLWRWATRASIALISVGKQPIATPGSTISKRIAQFAELSSQPVNTSQHKHADEPADLSYKVIKCLRVEQAGHEDVYCLTVPEFGYFPLGNGVLVSNCQDERQFDSAQGVERHIVVVEEATQIAARLILMFRGWCRMTPDQKKVIPEQWRDTFPKILYTANPVGKSLSWFRRHFVKARPDFAIEEVDGFLRQYIPSRATDNKSIDLKAHKGRLAAFDPALAKALDEGDWDSPVGDYFKQYDEQIHMLPDFIPPDWWFKYRGFDWGSAEPFCVLWACVADGTEFKSLDGRTLWAQAGAIIIYREWYGCDPLDPAKGLGMRNPDIAKGILDRSREPDIFKLVVTDSLPFQDRGNSGPAGQKFTTADDFKENGVYLKHGNCARVYGWKQMGDRLLGNERGPMLFVTESCKHLREYIPAIERDPTNIEDCVSDGEATHAPDTCRLICTTKPWVRTKPAEIEPLHAKRFHSNITPEAILKKLNKK